jgi:TDG/mug DNA glycosylase family protein
MVLPDLLAPGLRVVFCGTAAGTVSARLGAYYAGPGNKFWPTLFKTGLTPHQLNPHEFPTLLNYGIGLTDLAKHVSGSDASLPKDAFDPAGLSARIRGVQPRMLAFTGKTAAAIFVGRKTSAIAYGPATMPDMPPLYVLPSTSGLASGNWNEAHWHALAALIRRESAASP